MVTEFGQFHNMGQAPKQALGPLSSESKDHGTHNAPPFPRLEFRAFQLGKILCFKPWVQKVERTRKINVHIERAGR